ncbi:hypothetical protein [Neobacillus niacini]|uniref:hypothetical protein n=1 Tax=Neobacillus niacini TaxID=86668 RepID=UPI000AB99B17|nr:hypothetical protein [Neobacillus niacini]
MVHMDHAVATMANDLSKISSQLEALSNDISAAEPKYSICHFELSQDRTGFS